MATLSLTEESGGSRSNSEEDAGKHEPERSKPNSPNTTAVALDIQEEVKDGESNGARKDAMVVDQSNWDHNEQQRLPRNIEESKSFWLFCEKEEYRAKDFGGRTAKLLYRAKRLHRSDISSRAWGRFEYYQRWGKLRATLIEKCKTNLDQVFGPDYDRSRFQEEYEKPCKPCVIFGLADDWPARKKWNFNSMRQEYGERMFKCGEDDDGYSVRIKLKHFLRYQAGTGPGGAKLDDSPLYIFDPNFDEDRISKSLLNEYRVPHLFDEDLFSMVGEDKRPPYRWILFGPARSGSCVHVDPLGTSAWNTLIRGHKLWALFPPFVQKQIVKGKCHVNWKTEDDEAVDWFVNILPRILDSQGPELESQLITYLQSPGETMYVPTNWWHAVLNLDDTIAVTQNFCSSGNFPAVWRSTRKGRTRMAGTWLEELKKRRPDLAEIAMQMDQADGFDLTARIQSIIEHKRRKKANKERKKGERQAKKLAEKQKQQAKQDGYEVEENFEENEPAGNFGIQPDNNDEENEEGDENSDDEDSDSDDDDSSESEASYPDKLANGGGSVNNNMIK